MQNEKKMSFASYTLVYICIYEAIIFYCKIKKKTSGMQLN